MFELAAYRKLNPTGRIVVVPILAETFLWQCLLIVQSFAFAFWVFRANVDGGGVPRVIAIFLSAFVPAYPPILRAMWLKESNEQALKLHLANFDVMDVGCSNDFDRDCIHDAIIHWYGSLPAFSAYVRGPFRNEILDFLRACGSVNPGVVLLIGTPILGSCWRSCGPLAAWGSLPFIYYWSVNTEAIWILLGAWEAEP